MTNYELKAGVSSVVRVSRQSTATLVERCPGYRSMHQIFTDDLRARADRGKKFYKVKAELVDPLTGQAVPGWDITLARYPILNRDKLGVTTNGYHHLPIDLVGVSRWHATKCKLMTSEEKSRLLTPPSSFHGERCAFYDLGKAKDLQVMSKALRALIVDLEVSQHRAGKVPFVQEGHFQRVYKECYYAKAVDRSVETSDYGRRICCWIQQLLNDTDERYQRFYSEEHQYRYKIPRPPAPRATISVSLRAFAIGPFGESGLETFEMGYVQRPTLELQAGRSVAIDIPPIFVPGPSSLFELSMTSDADCLLQVV